MTLYGKPRCKLKDIRRVRKEQEDTGFWWGNLREKDYLEEPDVDVDGRILKWIFNKWVGEHGLDSSDSG